MKNLIFLISFFFSFISHSFSKSYINTSKINYYLLERIGQISENEKIPIYIIFKDHLGLKDFDDISYDTPKAERRKMVIERLQKYAAQSQAEVKRFLDAKIASGQADKYEILWTINSLILKADKSVITELANSKNNIRSICYDEPAEILINDELPNIPFKNASVSKTQSFTPGTIIDPGIVLMKADQCWALGNKGEGVLLADADDGFWWRHPDLVHNIWQNLGEDANHNGRTLDIQSGTGSSFDAGDLNGIDDDGNGKIDDLIGWNYRQLNNDILPELNGTGALGQMIGDGTGGTKTGVAPGAKCMVLRIPTISGPILRLAFQYALVQGADIITSNVTFRFGNSPPDFSLYRQQTDISLAAGIINTSSSGNDGLPIDYNQNKIPINITCPSTSPPPWLHPDQLKRGGVSGLIGVGNVDAATDVISPTSPYGPVTWGNWWQFGPYSYEIPSNYKDYPYSVTSPIEIPDSMGLIKPDVTAPGDGSISTYVTDGTGYASYKGTEAANAHTAGCIALMLSINPEMLPADIDKVLELTAVEKGAPGKDNRYGSGRIDALAATTSPRFLVQGITSASNMLISKELAPSDTAKELVGLKISAPLNPQVGSLKKIIFDNKTTATATDVTSFDLYWDVDRDGVIDAGDRRLKSIPFTTGALVFDTLKFKFLDTARTLILAARTTGSATSKKTVTLNLSDTAHVIAYYTTTALSNNFPIGNTTGIGNGNTIVDNYSLSQNYPNPFNPTTIIKYNIAKSSFVSIKVYDVLGKEVVTLINGFKNAGNYQVEFDTRDNNVASGIYYYRMEVKDQNFTDIKKMILVK